ncbi:SepM family pheromone-processing serine protease [Aneurinibacillus sp. Ricciae_BoGa-3]|uniref:SepM family pheromone-processing serine protease n=1 Tax=Aneurinibacillus sp. Ricciae_BoGa-3 TaxID=3022697 RepID=UPI0023422282|nr:SepM family pheromone-processing serine protease [Aneurinibacillus sp. Ricciae_BoGa-3]WCK53020.1 SepM family pheromone-processing serine protease [Aneurinibacillus sp. Ricciae_BoGa-3]
MNHSGRRTRWFNRWSASVLVIIAALAVMWVALTPTPYYAIRPGSAIELQPIVNVQGGTKKEKGTLMLTTVQMGPTNVLGYILAKYDPYADLMKADEIHSPSQSDAQYEKQELEVMRTSQQKAEMVAFRKTGTPFTVKNEGAIVMDFVPGKPAEKYLQVGDTIVAVDGEKVTTGTDLLNVLKGRKVGEKIAIKLLRDGQPKQVSIALAQLQTVKGQPARAGLGIFNPETKRQLMLSRNVTIISDQIGGPSAGMMFTLEIINQLSKQDLTKGYRIAGTGEIFEDGSVGRIGGIAHKVQASDKVKADIFFAPNDIVPAGVKSNYEEAKEAADKLHTKMKIVPVRTVDDALAYLRSLPPKKINAYNCTGACQ